MYRLTTPSKRVEKMVLQAVSRDSTIRTKARELCLHPRTALFAHKLKGKLAGKWGCSLGYDLRMVYIIDDDRKEVVVLGIGTHKIYR